MILMSARDGGPRHESQSKSPAVSIDRRALFEESNIGRISKRRHDSILNYNFSQDNLLSSFKSTHCTPIPSVSGEECSELIQSMLR